jgi:hypothetical protein
VWQDISGAATQNRAPVDADFGYALRVAEIPNGDVARAAYSTPTNLVQELPAQSIGATLLANGSMETGNPPTGWGAQGSATLSAAADERTSGAGAQSLSAVRGSTNVLASKSYTPATGDLLLLSAWRKSVDGVAGAGLGASAGSTGVELWFTGYSLLSSWNAAQTIIRAPATTLYAVLAVQAGGGNEARFDDYKAEVITRNAQLVAPSADMQIDVRFTLPVSAFEGTQVWVTPRISDFSSGNYWLALLVYTGGQWNITLYSVASHTRTSRTSASNIGTTNGVRINMNGNSISLYTTTDAFTTAPTQRGSTVTNSLYNSATGVNVLATPDVTPGNASYAPAT